MIPLGHSVGLRRVRGELFIHNNFSGPTKNNGFDLENDCLLKAGKLAVVGAENFRSAMQILR
jgi:hypothetical protein